MISNLTSPTSQLAREQLPQYSSRSDLVSSDAPRLGHAVIRSNSANQLCQGDTASGDGLEMQTDSEALLDAGIALAQENWAAFMEETGWAGDTANRVITHQVGSAHQRRLFEALEIDPELDYATFPGWVMWVQSLCRLL